MIPLTSSSARQFLGIGGLFVGLNSLTTTLCAARIGDITETVWQAQALRFLTLADPSVRFAVLGTVLLGIVCGLLGGFLVVRRMSLVGDALSHAVLPGVALGFLWNMEKDPVAIFIGATVAGLLGTGLVHLITRTTRLKEDAALGMILAGFFGAGLCLMSMFQRLPTGNKTGIDKFLFGQASAIGSEDIRLMAVVTVLVLGLICVGYKEFLLVSFDPGFSKVCALPTRWLQHGLMLLLTFSVVIALQAVGAVLVSAMLITPAATAYLLTDRMHRMLIYGTLIGMLSGVTGAFLSFLGTHLPTGPFMVLSASGFFVVAFFFAPNRGVIPRWWMARSQRIRIVRENTLKAVYQILENEEFRRESVSLRELAERRRLTFDEVLREVRSLVSVNFATAVDDSVALTPSGWQRAASIVRNHRLWELYLTHAVQMAPDHVHDDAEKIEHVLGEDAVRQLERRLEFADRDPHGRPIPAVQAIHGHPNGSREKRVTGYGKSS